MSVYLYGIIAAAADVPQDVMKLAGVGNPPGTPRLLRHRALAAIVSDVAPDELASEDLRALRRNMKAHAAVQNAVAAATTMLPVRFGVAFPDEPSILTRLLEPRHALLQRYLRELADSVEVTLKATYIEDRALEQAVRDRPDLLPPRPGRTATSVQSKIELGRKVAAAIQARRDREARAIYDTLARHARGARSGKTTSDLMVLNASFLVDRNRMAEFDDALAQVHRQVGAFIQLDCVGPLPPYSFVDLKL